MWKGQHVELNLIVYVWLIIVIKKWFCENKFHPIFSFNAYGQNELKCLDFYYMYMEGNTFIKNLYV